MSEQFQELKTLGEKIYRNQANVLKQIEGKIRKFIIVKYYMKEKKRDDIIMI